MTLNISSDISTFLKISLRRDCPEAVLLNPTVRLQSGAEYPFVNMAAVNSGTRWAYADDRRNHSGGGSKFQDGDTLMARITPCLENGKIARYRTSEDLTVAHGSTEFIVIRGRPKVTDNEFAYYLTQSPAIRDYAISQMTGTSGRQRVPIAALDHVDVTLPPLSEQRRIAQFLGALDDKIELNRRMNDTLEQMTRALFKSWFVDFDPVRARMDGRWQRGKSLPGLSADLYDLFPDRLVPSELGDIPEGWTVSCFGNLAEIAGGNTPSTKEPAYWVDGTHRFTTPKDLSSLSVPMLLDTERRITDAGLDRISSGLLPVGTVLMSSRAPIGYIAIAQNPVAVNQGFIAMEAKPGVSNLFLLYCTKFSQDEIVSRANGSTFLEISKTNFRPIPVLMPDDAIMERYDATAKPLVDRIVVNCKVIWELASQRDALLPRLVSGALRLPVTVDTSAEQS